MSVIIDKLSSDSKAKAISDSLRNEVECRLRNKAAHTIISVNDDTIKKYTGMSSDEIFDKLKEFLELCGYRLNEDLYDKMNDILISEI